MAKTNVQFSNVHIQAFQRKKKTKGLPEWL